MSYLNFEDTIKQIQELTEYNDHTSAYILGAKLVGANVLTEKLKLFKKMRDLSGYLDDAMSKFQYALYKELIALASDQLSEKQYNEFYNSF